MEIVSALKKEASKLQKQLNSINSAVEILGGKTASVMSSMARNGACLQARESQNSEGAKSAVGKVSSSEGEGEELYRTGVPQGESDKKPKVKVRLGK